MTDQDAKIEMPVIRGELLYCPRCRGRLVGFADVTVHPTVRIGPGGRLAVGTIVEDAAAIHATMRSSLTTTLHDELRCERQRCGYYVKADDLQSHLTS